MTKPPRLAITFQTGCAKSGKNSLRMFYEHGILLTKLGGRFCYQQQRTLSWESCRSLRISCQICDRAHCSQDLPRFRVASGFARGTNRSLMGRLGNFTFRMCLSSGISTPRCWVSVMPRSGMAAGRTAKQRDEIRSGQHLQIVHESWRNDYAKNLRMQRMTIINSVSSAG